MNASKDRPKLSPLSETASLASRRRFMVGALGLGAGILLTPLYANAASGKKPSAAPSQSARPVFTRGAPPGDNQPYVDLNDGKIMPQLGLGVWRLSPDEARVSILAALTSGYRSIDTAAIYKNEEAVGAAFRESGLKREEVFITTKVWNDEQGFDASQKALEKSLKRLGLDYVDLLLIHWPVPQQDLYSETWRAFIKMREARLVDSIGVSNFDEAQIKRIVSETGVAPVVNQIQLHPYLPQRALREFHAKSRIYTQSWSPLAQGKVIGDPEIKKIAEKHGKTVAQIVIRWHLQNNLIVIPRSSKPTRVRENFDVFNFTLSADDMAIIDGLEVAAF